MKTHKFSIYLIAIAALTLMIVSSCHHNTVTNNPCGNAPVFASWKVDGTSYQATALSGAYSSTATSITIFGCVPSGQQSPSISMEIPQPIRVGTFDLKKTVNSTGAVYGTNFSHFYYSDASTNTGTLTVTSMSMVDSTYDATFQFTVQDSLDSVIHITDGQIISAGF